MTLIKKGSTDVSVDVYSDMRPLSSGDDVIDHCTGNIVLDNQVLWCHSSSVVSTQVDHSGFSQFRMIVGSMSMLVVNIICASSPIKVTKRIIGSISISMTGFVSRWVWAYKCFQNQMVNVTPGCSPFKLHCVTDISLTDSIFIQGEGLPVFTNPPSVILTTPYRSIITDTITKMINNFSIFNSHISIVPEGVACDK